MSAMQHTVNALFASRRGSGAARTETATPTAVRSIWVIPGPFMIGWAIPVPRGVSGRVVNEDRHE